MNARGIGTIAVVSVSVALFVLGILTFRVCGGGLSLIVFGAAIALVGGVAAGHEGNALLIFLLIVVAVLVVAGVSFGNASGCSF